MSAWSSSEGAAMDTHKSQHQQVGSCRLYHRRDSAPQQQQGTRRICPMRGLQVRVSCERVSRGPNSPVSPQNPEMKSELSARPGSCLRIFSARARYACREWRVSRASAHGRVRCGGFHLVSGGEMAGWGLGSLARLAGVPAPHPLEDGRASALRRQVHLAEWEETTRPSPLPLSTAVVSPVSHSSCISQTAAPAFAEHQSHLAADARVGGHGVQNPVREVLWTDIRGWTHERGGTHVSRRPAQKTTGVVRSKRGCEHCIIAQAKRRTPAPWDGAT